MSIQTDTGFIDELMREALSRGQTTLSEDQSRQVLAAYGVPVVEGLLARDAAEAAAAADRLGYPVALKACAPGLPHKSDRGLVHLGLANGAAVGAAVETARSALGDTPAEGYLVQRMARGRREIIAGGVRDPLFGPCVLLGIGGIAVEAVGDVSFRLAPLDARDVEEMIAELKGRALLDGFRGDTPVDRGTLVEILQAVGRILADHPRVTHVDINPLVIEGGRPVAVDALITLGAEPAAAEPAQAPLDPARFRALFEPESLAIVGVSDSPLKWGFRILFNTLEGGYKGRLYGVNPKYPNLMGVPCFPSVTALPEAVDLALIVVPPRGVMPALKECADKGVKTALVITAGFGEVDDDEARAAQEQLAEFARSSGLLVIGPNCAGVASPAPAALYSGMISRFPGAGGLSIVSQSGNVGSTVLTWASVHQVGIARFISTGNEAAVRTADYLDFLAEDERTTSIITYVESAKNGRRFFERLRAASARKPVVLIKGGRSRAGMRAAQSHTGALASEIRLFQAVCRQAGVSMVDDVYEAMEVGAVLMDSPLPRGRRVAIVSQGGGWGVIGADACADAGLDVVPLPDATLAELDSFLPAWWSRNNPIDLVAGTDLGALPRTVETVMKCPVVDAVILLGIGYVASAVARYEKSAKAQEIGLDKLAAMGCQVELGDARRMAEMVQEYGKPLLVASDTVLLAYGPHPNEVIAELERLGIYAFSSPRHVARALAHLAERHEYLAGIPRDGRQDRP